MQANGPVATALASKRPTPPAFSIPLQQGAPETEQLPHSAAAPPGYGNDGIWQIVLLLSSSLHWEIIFIQVLKYGNLWQQLFNELEKLRNYNLFKSYARSSSPVHPWRLPHRSHHPNV